MKKYTFLFLLPLLFAQYAKADSIVMKDGTTYDGRIIERDAETYLVEINVTRSIKDQRRIKRSDVKKIIITAADTEAYEKIKDLVPTKDGLSEKQYRQIIERKVRPFLDQYRHSKHKKKVEKMMATLKKEFDAIKKGGLKLNGKLITAEQKKENAYELDAYKHYQEIKVYAEKRAHGKYLEGFNKLLTNFPGTKACKEGHQQALITIEQYRQSVERSLQQVSHLKQQRRKTLERLPENERRRAIAEQKRQDTTYKELLAREKSEKKLWLTLHQNHAEPMQIVLKNLQRARNYIDSIKINEIPDTGQLYKEGWKLAAEKEKAPLETILATLKRHKVPDKYYQNLVKRYHEAPDPEAESTEE